MTTARQLLYGLALVAALCLLIWIQQQRIDTAQAQADLATERLQAAQQRNVLPGDGRADRKRVHRTHDKPALVFHQSSHFLQRGPGPLCHRDQTEEVDPTGAARTGGTAGPPTR